MEATAHGSDFIDGGLGDDEIQGGGAADNLFGGAGKDKIFGDTGAASRSAFFVDLAQHGNDYIDGEDRDDAMSLRKGLQNGGRCAILHGRSPHEASNDADTKRRMAA